ncbi:hypothetical protein [Caballeronia grimmiae]|uniref:hypothetical protein n=1 Tax=Caballeronia grimmiae TaxID=1071679 RepID=UPI0038B78C5F
MRDAKIKSEGRPTDSRDWFCRIARPGAHAQTAAAALTRRNQRARRTLPPRAAMLAISRSSTGGAPWRASGRATGMFAASGALHSRPMRAA